MEQDEVLSGFLRRWFGIVVSLRLLTWVGTALE